MRYATPTTPHYTTLQHTTLQYATLLYTSLHYTNYTIPQLQLQLQLQLYTHTLITLQLQIHYSGEYSTLQLQLQLRYTTLHQAVVGDVTTATSAATLKKHNSNHLSVHQWIRSAIRDSQQPTSPIGFSMFKTSASALCGTTGNHKH